MIRDALFDATTEKNYVSLVVVDRSIDTDNAMDNFFRITFEYKEFSLENSLTPKQRKNERKRLTI